MRKFYKWSVLLLIFAFFDQPAIAQLNNADSTLFNSIFTAPLYIPYWNFPYTWYVDDSIKSKSEMQNRFNIGFPFTPADFNLSTYKNIHTQTISYVTDVNASFNQLPWIYNQTDPVVMMPFTLNGKTDTAYSAFTPSAVGNSCRTAFLLIHGNGINTTTLMLQGNGYGAVYCNIKNTCLQYGDVYSYSKPNEDWRAMYWNRKKLNDYVYNYCEAIGHNYGTNYLIETIALMKSLRSNYSRVIVMGLSEGGYTTLLNSLSTEPDGAVVSAGYSINFDIFLPSQFVLSNRFGNAPQYFTRDTVKAMINRSQTNTLFTYGEGDVVDLMDPEHDFHYTQNFLNNPGKCSFFYNFNTHTFPPCNTLDTFIQRILGKPKAFIYATDTVCISDSLQLKFKFCGQPPFQFQLYKNDLLVTTLTTNVDTMMYTVFSAGRYQIKNIIDATNHPCINSEVYEYIKDAPIGFNVTSKSFSCDSNHSKIMLHLTGTSPWIVSKTFNGAPMIDTLHDQQVLQTYANGQLTFLQINDSNHCSLSLNQSFTLADSLINVSMSAPVYDCDSNKTRIDISLEGRSPWKLYYKKNGNADSLTINTTLSSLYFSNGLYEFTHVRDSNQCVKSINELHTFNFDSLSLSSTMPTYLCDSNKTQIQFNLQGNPPFEIHYLQDGNPMTISTAANNISVLFVNGVYDFQYVSDATGCSKPINLQYTFSAQTIDFTLNTPAYDCDSNKTHVHFDLVGNAPWTLHYTWNGNAQFVTSIADTLDLYLKNGLYNFIQLTDATCNKNINQSFVFNFDTIDVQLTTPSYSCDSSKMQIQFTAQGNPPFDIHLTQDGLPVTLQVNDYIFTKYFINGSYDFLNISDALGCMKPINQSFNFTPVQLSYNIATPVYDCDSNKTKIHFDLTGNAPWNINYMQDGQPQQMTTFANAADLYLENGTYFFTQISDMLCIKNVNEGFSFNKDTIGIQISPPVYQCDSNKTLLTVDLQGNPPFAIHYLYNGSPVTINTSDALNHFYFSNGTYDFIDVTDATNCTRNIGQNFLFDTNPIAYTLATPVYNCDSNKTRIHFDLQGNSPWLITYTKDGIAQQATSIDDSLDIFVNNGLYQFIKIEDAYCSIAVNQSFSFNYEAVDVVFGQEHYRCDSNKTELPFQLAGNPPFTLQYIQDGIPMQFTTVSHAVTLLLPNGNYTFQTLSDATGCLHNINQLFSFNYHPIDLSVTSPVYDCDSNKTHIHFDLQGNAPWTIQYALNGQPQQLSTAVNYADLYAINGNYQFIQLSDATCQKNISQGYAFNYNSIDAQLSAPVYVCDSNKSRIIFTLQGNPPFTIQYTHDGTPLQFNTNNNILPVYFDNGNFVFQQVMDATGCFKTIAQSFNFQFDTIGVELDTPRYDCDSNKTHIHLALQGNAPFVIAWLFNGNPQSMITNNYTADLFLNNGNYDFIQVRDGTNCIKTIGQSYAFNYTPIAAVITQEKYDCDSNKYRIDFSLQGNPPWKINCHNGAVYQTLLTANPSTSLYLSNGNWVIDSVTDYTNCNVILNHVLNLNFTPLNVNATPAVYDCDSNKSRIDFNLNGNAPWTIRFTETNLNIADSVLTYDPNFSLFLGNGLYLVGPVSDSTGCSYTSGLVVNNFYTPLTFQQIAPTYDCDSTKMRMEYTFTGDQPFKLTYKNNINGIVTQISSALPTIVFYLPDGDYTVLSVQDLKCIRNIDDTIQIHYPKLISTLQPAAISCDSNKMFVRFSTPQGNAPYTYYYYFDNVYKNFTTYDTLYTLYLNNGQYFFDKVTDSMGCSVAYQQALTVDYHRFSYLGHTLSYRCDKDSTALLFAVTPYMKTFITYTFNGGTVDTFTVTPNGNFTFLLSNGQYHLLSITDSLGCSQTINETFTIQEEPIDVAYNTIMNCTTRNYTYQFHLQGKSPWTLRYNFQNQPQSQLLIDSNATWDVEAGNYFIKEISDANGCVFSVQKQDSLKYFLKDFPTLYYRDYTLHTIHTPYQYFWYKDDHLIDSLSVSDLPSHGNGVYKVLIVDSLGCHNWSNELTLAYPADINVFPNPSHTLTNIVVNDDYGDYWHYQLFDMSGKLLSEKKVEVPSAQIDLSALEAGVYSLIIRYELETSKQKNVIRILKD